MIKDPPKLARDEFIILRDLIYQWTGVMYEERKAYLIENRVLRRINDLKLKSFAEYIQLLKSGAAADEREAFIDIVTTHETYFFRNMPQLEAFARHALPDTAARLAGKGDRVIRIWSAACSSGEEPYTLVMIMDRIKAAPGMETRVLGTDISGEVIKRAREGVYDQYSLRAAPEDYLGVYFRETGRDRWALDEKIRSGVKFEKANLLDAGALIPPRSMDIVFLRNVLIYFDDEMKRRVVGNMARALRPGGYLFIGHSETLHRISDEFGLLIADGVPLYRRK